MTQTLTDLSQLTGPAVQIFVPCPFCKGFQALHFARLFWPDGRPEEAGYRCVLCEEVIPGHFKTWMLDRMGFHPAWPRAGVPVCTNALYAPVGLGLSWGQIAGWFVQMKDNPELLKPFWITVLGMAWEERDRSREEAPALDSAEEIIDRGIDSSCGPEEDPW